VKTTGEVTRNTTKELKDGTNKEKNHTGKRLLGFELGGQTTTTIRNATGAATGTSVTPTFGGHRLPVSVNGINGAAPQAGSVKLFGVNLPLMASAAGGTGHAKPAKQELDQRLQEVMSPDFQQAAKARRAR
jgi:hypothetical protein